MSIRDELMEQIVDSICDACLEYKYEDVPSCPYGWGEGKCQDARDAVSRILAIPALAHLLALAEQAEQEGFEVVVVDNKAELPPIPDFRYDKEEDRELLRRGAINYSKLLSGWRKVVRND